jgi:cyclophilin family peptidyl-prolyl cis-trans isomerase
VFGRVIDGMQYVDAIARGEPPANPSKILHAYIAADSPPAYAPPPPPAPLPSLSSAQSATVSLTPAKAKLAKPAPKPAAKR